MLCASTRNQVLGQGKLVKFKATIHFNTNNLTNLKNYLVTSNITNSDKLIKQKFHALLKFGVKSAPLGFYNELCQIGWLPEEYKIKEMFDSAADAFFVHSNCYLWSFGIEFDENQTTPLNLDKLVFESLIKVR